MLFGGNTVPIPCHHVIASHILHVEYAPLIWLLPFFPTKPCPFVVEGGRDGGGGGGLTGHNSGRNSLASDARSPDQDPGQSHDRARLAKFSCVASANSREKKPVSDSRGATPSPYLFEARRNPDTMLVCLCVSVCVYVCVAAMTHRTYCQAGMQSLHPPTPSSIHSAHPPTLTVA